MHSPTLRSLLAACAEEAAHPAPTASPTHLGYITDGTFDHPLRCMNQRANIGVDDDDGKCLEWDIPEVN